MGLATDNINRKWLLSIGCLLWSITTVVSGMTDRFSIFVAMRIALGIICSICNPAAYSLIRDYFPPAFRSTANSIYSSGIYLG
jgi:MFS family permease